MEESELFLLGSIIKPKGLKGLLKINATILEGFPADNFEVFLTKTGKLIPFQVSTLRHETKDLVIGFSEINSIEEAISLVNFDIYAKKSDFIFKKNPFSYLGLKGFTLIDEVAGFNGLIEEVLEFPQQYIAVIHERPSNNAPSLEILIPLNQDLILKIEKKNKQVFASLPDGLLEIYRDQ
jgi:16S rRNA processing protein RimM